MFGDEAIARRREEDHYYPFHVIGCDVSGHHRCHRAGVRCVFVLSASGKARLVVVCLPLLGQWSSRKDSMQLEIAGTVLAINKCALAGDTRQPAKTHCPRGTSLQCAFPQDSRASFGGRRSNILLIIISLRLSLSLSIYLSLSRSERATRGRQIHGFCVGISTFRQRTGRLVVSCGRCHFHIERTCDGQNTNTKRLLPSVK